MIVVYALGGTLLLLVLLALRQWGVVNGVQMDLAHRLPAGSPLRVLLLRPASVLDDAFNVIKKQPLTWAVRCFALAYVVGGAMFSVIEPDASFWDGLWWAYISMMTVGYGDLSPKSWEVRALAYWVIFFGWASLIILGSTLAARIKEEREHRHDVLDTADLGDDFEHLERQSEENHQSLCAHLRELKALTSHPEVVRALEVAHNERKAS